MSLRATTFVMRRGASYGNPNLTQSEITAILSTDQQINLNIPSLHRSSLASNVINEDFQFNIQLKNSNVFGVLDGHWSPVTSKYLSTELPKTINFYSNTDSKPDILRKSFRKIDKELLELPFKLLLKLHSAVTCEEISLLDVKDRLSILKQANISFSGACALVAILESDKLTLANSGDCRALLGSLSNTGKWIAEALTIDHTPSNQLEMERLLTEHPNEHGTVAFSPTLSSPLRVLGGCF
jgi:serine/threonine protein phosphatase PrpC